MTEDQILHKFYTSTEYRKMSFLVKTKSKGVCADCGREDVPYEEMRCHHIIPLNLENINVPEIALAEDNLVAICHDCHNRRHNRFCSRMQKSVYIVYGAPCSGKTTAVKETMEQNDIMWDFDGIREAIAGTRYGVADGAKDAIFALRKAFYQHIKDRSGKWETAYIIGGFASRIEREVLAKELRASLLYINTSKAECVERLNKDVTRKGERERFRVYIEDWFEKFNRAGGESPPDVAFI